jgi:hypothetical protein
MALEVGKWYAHGRMGWVKVLRYDPVQSPTFPFQVRSLLMRSVWWADAAGEPNNHRSPKIIARRRY